MMYTYIIAPAGALAFAWFYAKTIDNVEMVDVEHWPRYEYAHDQLDKDVEMVDVEHLFAKDQHDKDVELVDVEHWPRYEYSWAYS